MRVVGTRVPLETIVTTFDLGATAEEISQQLQESLSVSVPFGRPTLAAPSNATSTSASTTPPSAYMAPTVVYAKRSNTSIPRRCLPSCHALTSARMATRLRRDDVHVPAGR